MTSQKEIHDCFDVMREEINSRHAIEIADLKRRNMNGSLDDKITEAVVYGKLFNMGLVILESFVSDVKRIADCADEQLAFKQSEFGDGH